MRAVLLAIILFFVVALCGAQEAQNATKQTASQENSSWDFGRVKEGEVLKHSFSLKNNSTKVLQIKSVHTSCGCTASKAEKLILQPGEATSLGVEFNTKGFKGKTEKHIYVDTDSLDNPLITYIIKAEVVTGPVNPS
ncbi:MAG: DUF1573 domain-containing protein [Candidatus Omnitrophota bacterium]